MPSGGVEAAACALHSASPPPGSDAMQESTHGMRETCSCKGVRKCDICSEKSVEGLKMHLIESQTDKVLLMTSRDQYVDVTSLVHDVELKVASLDNVQSIESVVKTLRDELWSVYKSRNAFDHCEGTHDIAGVMLYENFIDQETEDRILEEIDRFPWSGSQSGRRKQDFGPRVNFKKQRVKLGSFHGLPSFSQCLLERMQSEIPQLATFEAVEQCHLEYVPDRGSCIHLHIDDTWLWGDRLVTVSLLSGSFLTLVPSKHSRSLSILVPMPARSLLVLTGSSRYDWSHAVSRLHIQDRRIAVTFRELSALFHAGGELEDVGKEILLRASSFDGHPTSCGVIS